MNFLRDPMWQFIGVLFAIIVVVAPFVYREIKRRLKKPGIDFVVTDHSCSLNLTVGNNLPRNDVFIDDGFHLDISGHFDVSINDPELADAYVHIHSIQTKWDMDLVEMEKVEVRVEVPKTDYIFENPILLRNRNFLPKCRFSTVIPIRIPPIEQNKYHPFKFIGSLTKFEVIINPFAKIG